MSALRGDPRQPSAERPYSPPPIVSDDLDFNGFTAVVLAISGYMLHNKVWFFISIIFSVRSLVNMKPGSSWKQKAAPLVFAVLGLVQIYQGKFDR